MPESSLFEPVKLGDVELKHRVVLAPLTRNRANAQHVHGDLAVEYYSQRASVPGTLLISEAITIAPEAGGRPHVPGIWSDERIDAWKKVTTAVHAKGSFIFAQLRAYGRSADPNQLKKEGLLPELVSSSDIPLQGNQAPRPLSIDEIHKYIGLFTQAALNAIQAGFDGVELHGANGYLIDQFTSAACNKRNDEYGGSAENRCRFALEIVSSVAQAVGEKRTAFRLSPWGTSQEMRMEDPLIMATFEYLVGQFVQRHPDLAYLHLVEPVVAGNSDRERSSRESNDFIREIWSPRRIISAGGYTREHAMEIADTKGDLIAFGRAFIGNPDLPIRLQKNLPLTEASKSTFYAYETPQGYTDFPTYEQYLSLKN